MLGPKGVGQAAMTAIVRANVCGGEEFIVLLSGLDAVDMLRGDLERAHFGRREEAKVGKWEKGEYQFPLRF
jgi:hypothetical protein